MKAKFLSLAAFAAIMLCLSAPAYAEDPRKKEADALFNEAVKLHRDDREAEAVEKYKKSYALFPMPNTLMGQARSEQLAGQHLDAIRHYREAIKSPLLHPTNVDLAKKYIAELETRLARVAIVGPTGARVTLNGETFRLPLEGPVDVAPGQLTLHGDLDGKALEGTTPAYAAQLTTLELKANDPPVVPPRPGITIEPPPVSPSAPTDAPRWILPGILGVAGLAGLTVGVVFGLKSGSATDEYDAQQCAARGGPECRDRYDQAGREQTISIVGYVAGAGLIAGAVAVWALWPKPTVGATRGSLWVLPDVGSQHATAAFGGTF